MLKAGDSLPDGRVVKAVRNYPARPVPQPAPEPPKTEEKPLTKRDLDDAIETKIGKLALLFGFGLLIVKVIQWLKH
jgi:hypothetical protein